MEIWTWIQCTVLLLINQYNRIKVIYTSSLIQIVCRLCHLARSPDSWWWVNPIAGNWTAWIWFGGSKGNVFRVSYQIWCLSCRFLYKTVCFYMVHTLAIWFKIAIFASDYQQILGNCYQRQKYFTWIQCTVLLLINQYNRIKVIYTSSLIQIVCRLCHLIRFPDGERDWEPILLSKHVEDKK